MVLAVVDLAFAVGTSVARRTFTCVRPLAGVETSAAVLTRFIVGAIVEILIAEQPTPAFVAHALPGMLTGAVKTTGIALTFVTQPAHPTRLASAKKEKPI